MPEIVCVRTVLADDGAHEHVDLVGYMSPHIPGEPILIPPRRIQQKMAAELERFWIERDGEKIDVKAGKCQVCGHEPYLVTEKDPADGTLLLGLPAG